MNLLPDPDKSRAILIGVHDYESPALPSLPAVEQNLADLSGALMNGDLLGLPVQNCVLLPQPSEPIAVLRMLRSGIREATDTLIIYYSGHGLVDDLRPDELLLSLAATDVDETFTALRYSDLRTLVAAPESRALRKLIVLDCCFSGVAHGTMAGDRVAQLAAVDGTCVLTATAPDRLALARSDERLTAFSGELIDILENGIDEAGEYLDANTLFLNLYARLLAKGRPLPAQSNRNAGASIIVARNRAYDPSKVRLPGIRSTQEITAEEIEAVLSRPNNHIATEPNTVKKPRSLVRALATTLLLGLPIAIWAATLWLAPERVNAIILFASLPFIAGLGTIGQQAIRREMGRDIPAGITVVAGAPPEGGGNRGFLWRLAGDAVIWTRFSLARLGDRQVCLGGKLSLWTEFTHSRVEFAIRANGQIVATGELNSRGESYVDVLHNKTRFVGKSWWDKIEGGHALISLTDVTFVKESYPASDQDNHLELFFRRLDGERAVSRLRWVSPCIHIRIQEHDFFYGAKSPLPQKNKG